MISTPFRSICVVLGLFLLAGCGPGIGATGTNPPAQFLRNAEEMYRISGVETREIPALLQRATKIVDGNLGGVTQHSGTNRNYIQADVIPPPASSNDPDFKIQTPNGFRFFPFHRNMVAYRTGHASEPVSNNRPQQQNDASLTPSAPGLDWLSYGIWVTKPPSSPAETGVFVDAPTERAYSGSLMTLTSTATYTGTALGIHATPTQSSEFRGGLELTADFGANTVSGRIEIQSHRVRGFQSALREIEMGETRITDTQPGGFFEGHTLGNPGYAGRYGGKFYGENSSQKPPEAVAGTFGASNETESVLGIFYGEAN